MPKKALTPRISMFAAIDTDGNLYYSVSQANNNSQTMSIFMQELCSLLDNHRKGWRKNTVVIVDNAPYHASKEAMQMYEQHLRRAGVPDKPSKKQLPFQQGVMLGR